MQKVDSLAEYLNLQYKDCSELGKDSRKFLV